MPEPPPVALIVWFGHEPLTVTLVPATMAGVAVPVPPLATGSWPVNVMFGVVPPLEAMLPLPVTEVTPPPPEPLAAAVIRPWASTVMLANVYAPAVTAVFANAMVPVVVTGPPVKPVPVATLVTVPEPPAVALTVWFGQEPDTVTLVPATMAGVAVPVPPRFTANRPVACVMGTLVALARLTAVGVPKLAEVSKLLTVICLVVLLWTRGICSVPASGVEAAGSSDIFMSAKIIPLFERDGG